MLKDKKTPAIKNLRPLTCETKYYVLGDDANEVARILQDTDYDDWTYSVQESDEGYVVRIEDENGEFVAFWTKETV